MEASVATEKVAPETPAVVPAAVESSAAPSAPVAPQAVVVDAATDAVVTAPPPETPLEKLTKALPAIIEKAGHDEMWGVKLGDAAHVPTAVILQKFLRANTNDVALAEKQLTSALEWRKKMHPETLLDGTAYDQAKFGDLGYVTVAKGTDGKDVVITWNIYGAVKDNKATFGDVEE